MFIFHPLPGLLPPPPTSTPKGRVGGRGPDSVVSTTNLKETHLPVFAKEQCWRGHPRPALFLCTEEFRSSAFLGGGPDKECLDVNIPVPSLRIIRDTQVGTCRTPGGLL